MEPLTIFQILFAAFSGEHSAIAMLLVAIMVIAATAWYFVTYFQKLYADEQKSHQADREQFAQKISEKDLAITGIIDDYKASSISATKALTAIAGLITTIKNGGSNE